MKHISSLFVGIIVALLLAVSVLGSHGVLHLFEIDKETERLSRKNQQLESEITQLSDELRALDVSSFELERTAREELGLSRRGDIVYIFTQRGQAE